MSEDFLSSLACLISSVLVHWFVRLPLSQENPVFVLLRLLVKHRTDPLLLAAVPVSRLLDEHNVFVKPLTFPDCPFIQEIIIFHRQTDHSRSELFDYAHQVL